MFEKNLGEGLGVKTKALLREFANKKRMTLPQYYAALDEYNKRVDELQKDERELNKIKSNFKNNLKKLANGTTQITKLKIGNFINKFANPINGFRFILTQIKDIVSATGKMVDIEFNGKIYSLNNNTYNRLLNIISDENIEEISSDYGSDKELISYSLRGEDSDIFKIIVFNPTHKRNKKQGDFFKYYHNTHFNFSRYGIHADKPNAYPNNCLIEALTFAGLSNEKINEARLLTISKHFPVCRLNEFANKLNIKIALKTVKTENQSKITIYGENGNTYNLCLLDEHYFVNEKTENTRFSLEHYDEIKHLKDCHNIKSTEGRVRRDATKFIDSWDLVRILLNNKNLLLRNIPTEDLYESQYFAVVEEDLSILTENATDFSPVEKKDTKPKNQVIIFFDFETISSNVHKPYLCCVLNDELKKSFIGEDCGLQMLKYLSCKYKNVLLIAHNASYDFRFILQYLHSVEEISAGNSIYTVEAKFNYMTVSIKDSYKLITMPLRNFPKTFNIKNTVKEVISYKFYNETSAIKERYMPIELMETYLLNEDKDIEQFRENLKRWELVNGEKFDCIEYSRRYCEIDCEILKQGYETFKKWMLEMTNLNIDNILTIASLAHQYFINAGCYEGVYELSGIPRAFIQRCVVGGRVMCANNEKYISNKKVNDFDAVSLYPSAMARMEGFLKGTPKIINNLDYNNVKNYSGFFVEICINKVGKERAFSLMSIKNENGIRIFSNDMIGKHLYVDKTTLEDLVRFQDIEFNIIRGYYFNEGHNSQINETIVKVFNERLRLKKEGNSAELVYKLIMNSGYGKSIMKPREDVIHYFNDIEKLNVFKSRNHQWIKTTEQIANSNLWRVKSIEPLSKHSNIAQVGVSILSMSKRIMNEVMCLAEDNKIPVFYQDTDSMHLLDEDIEKLSCLFKETYSRELIGKKLGQFHSDFDLKGCENVKANRSIFLGKKCYIDELTGINSEGKEEIGYHVRMKGVPLTTIKYTANKLNIGLYELYEKLYQGDKINFDLTENGKKDNFVFHTNGLISTALKFSRDIKF